MRIKRKKKTKANKMRKRTGGKKKKIAQVYSSAVHLPSSLGTTYALENSMLPLVFTPNNFECLTNLRVHVCDSMDAQNLQSH